MLEYKKKLTVGQKAAVGAALSATAVFYVWHRKKLNAVIELSQAAVQDTMWSSFDEGVRYGIALTRQAVEDGKELSKYAFDVFDKPAA